VSKHVLADNGVLHQQILEIFGEIFRGQFRAEIPSISG